jgi:hypothetical protein
MYEKTAAKVFILKQISKSVYIIQSQSGYQLTSPRIHASLQDAISWAEAWASSWVNARVIYEG